MSKQTEALKLALEWIGDAVVVLSHTSTAIQGGIGADAEGVGGCSVGVVAAIREALAEQPAQDDPCIKCKGLGYYDEGHECDDGSMAGGNYVECDKCKQPDFIKHEVENAYDWSDWVCPDPKSYLMKCCDCGLVHEAQFGVVRYKSEAEREGCDMVDDPNLQAVFRMRRSEQWSPEDTAHRAGGLPMEQPAQPQQEPVAWWNPTKDSVSTDPVHRHNKDCQPLYTSPPASKPLHIGDESAAFKAWFDAWWVGDGEQGETIPTQSDKHYLTYLDQYTLGFGAWMAAKHAAHGITGEQK